MKNMIMKNILYIHTMVPIKILKQREDGTVIVQYDNTSIITCNLDELLFLN